MWAPGRWSVGGPGEGGWGAPLWAPGLVRIPASEKEHTECNTLSEPRGGLVVPVGLDGGGGASAAVTHARPRVGGTSCSVAVVLLPSHCVGDGLVYSMRLLTETSLYFFWLVSISLIFLVGF